MSKKYEYFVILQEKRGSLNSTLPLDSHHDTITLDHPLGDTDIRHIENQRHHDFLIVDWKLLKVTGTFTYTFLISLVTIDGDHRLRNFRQSYDHKITTETISADYNQFAHEFWKNKGLSNNIADLEILFHLEIPDE